MLTLINTNRMTPPIAPIGLDYVGEAVRQAGLDVELVDLALADDPDVELDRALRQSQPELVGLTFRNVDDCFWPSGQSFLPVLERDVAAVRSRTDSPIVLGGVGFSILAEPIVARTGADFGIRGDGEQAIVSLLSELRGDRQWERVPGLIYRRDGVLLANPPAWPQTLSMSPRRALVDNATYFRRAGQMGVETKRGCGRPCIYCADPLAKGRSHRLRDPSEAADEVEGLCGQGVDVLHLCDPEFNLPPGHAQAVCQELIRRGLGRRVRWYA
jgi:tryptophan 2-C-methyltransferase